MGAFLIRIALVSLGFWFLGKIAMNIIEMLSVLIGGVPGRRSRGRFYIGIAVFVLGHVFVAVNYFRLLLSFGAVAVRDGANGWIVFWIMYLAWAIPLHNFVCIGRNEYNENMARAQAEGSERYSNAEIEARQVTLFLCYVAFLVMIAAMSQGWNPSLW